MKKLTQSKIIINIKRRKIQLSTLFVVIVVSGLLLFSILDTRTIPFDPKDFGLINAEMQNIDEISYSPHASIYIDGVSDIISQGWPGSGSNDDPYVISGLNISGPSSISLIEIRNLAASIKINDCILVGGKIGIEFYEVGSYSGSISTISNNIITKSTEHGILLSCNSTRINSNTITYNGKSGINISDFGVNINITCNNFISNSEYGVAITQNIIQDNEISWNCFIANNLGGSSQALDEGTNNKFEYNYWDDWVSQSDDASNDGILDSEYPIQGGNTDNFPRARCCMYITQATQGFEIYFAIIGIIISVVKFRKRTE